MNKPRSIELLKNKVVLVIFITILTACSEGVLEKFKNLREKANKIKDNVKVVTESKRGAPIQFAPKSNILYPGLDRDKADRVKQMWQEYYDCQQALFEATEKMVVPIAIGFLQGSNAVLECEVCESPNDMFLDPTWFYAADYNMIHVEEVTLSDSVLIKNDSLHVHNLEENHGGLYVCKKGNHSARPYVVHVFTDEPIKLVVPEGNAHGPHPTSDQSILGLPLALTTVWSEWTQCSRCDSIGKRHRTGICTIVADQSEPRQKRLTNLPPLTTHNVSSSNESQWSIWKNSNEQQLNKNKTKRETSEITSTPVDANNTEIHSETTTTYSTVENQTKLTIENISKSVKFTADIEMINLFEEGIPCRSKMLSVGLRNLEVVSNRSSEVLEAYCKLSCPKSVLFVVVDEQGNILETANNSEGIYSVIQGLPQDIPGVSRTVEFATYKEIFKMECPGNRNGDVPVEWYVGHKAITNQELRKETQGRIKIDEYNRITFSPALLEDSRVFSCWQRNELVGTVRLLVEKKHNLKFQRPVMIIGTLIIFGTFFWVYYSAFTNS